MEQKINIAEILKDCPKGTKLYSPLCGECYFDTVTQDPATKEYTIFIAVSSVKITFTECGRYFSPDKGECLLFPSKDCRTWENFKAPWQHKNFEAGQKVLVKTDFFDAVKREAWCLDIYSHFDTINNVHYLIGGRDCEDSDILSYEHNESLLGKEV